MLEIDDRGVHRLRATYAQLVYTKCRLSGQDDTAARMAVSQLLGHNRKRVTFHYIPECNDWETYRGYVDPADDHFRTL
ncbi:MAG: hypothetical protein JXB85_02115 [Anaerolineales bacterium]|nr:hypothetical protein [Anaerolineales bacterium]